MRSPFARWRIGARLRALVLIFALGCAALSTLLIWQQTRRAVAARQHSLEMLVDSAIGVLEAHRKLAEAGVMSEDDAKKRALSVIGTMRYGNGDYFFVRDRRGIGLMHPVQPETVGKDNLNVPDAQGRFFMREMRDVVDRDGQGFVTYSVIKPGPRTEIEKTTFIKRYEPWGMSVATGVYIDDLAAEMQEAAQRAALLALALIVALGGVTALITRGIVRPLARLRGAMLALAEGREISARLEVERADEIGEMARTVEVFGGNAKARIALEDKSRHELRERAERQTRIEKLIGEFRASIGTVLDAVTTSTQKLETTATTLSRIASEASAQADTAAKASQQAAGNVDGVAAAAEELGASVEEIGRAQVTGIQSSTKDAVEAIRAVAGTMEEIGRFTGAISSTVEEQSAATREISRNVGFAAKATGSAANNVSTVTTAIGEASRSAKDVLGATGELANTARRLQTSVDGFLVEVAA